MRGAAASCHVRGLRIGGFRILLVAASTMPRSAWFWCELFHLVGPPRYYNLGRLCCSRSYACRGSQIARCLLVYYAQGLLLKSRAADLASGQASRASKGYYACTVPILLFFFCKQRLIRALACGHNERALQAQRAIKNTYSVCGNSPSVDAFAEEEDRSSIKTSRMIQPRQTEGAPTFHRRTDTPGKQVTRKLLFLLHPL